MLITTTDILNGSTVKESLGLVKGTIVQSKNIGRDFMAGMKNLVGGEVKSYTQMISEARNVATERMIEEAKNLGADAIIGVRYGSSAIMQGMAEIIAYGTAVKLEK
ncbi:MAG: YbjQ family protein [Bacilli bacterium]|nr:YbjQ family protein [Bacilli bacterium]